MHRGDYATESVSVGNSKISNYSGAQSTVKSSYDVLNFGGTVMPALRVTYRERNLKFIIPRRVFSREFREGQKVRLYYQFVSLSLSVREAIPRREREGGRSGQRQYYSWRSVRAKQAEQRKKRVMDAARNPRQLPTGICLNRKPPLIQIWPRKPRNQVKSLSLALLGDAARSLTPF